MPFRTGERITFNYLVRKKYVGESAQVRYLRDGKMQECDLLLTAMKRLVPVHIEGKLSDVLHRRRLGVHDRVRALPQE